MNFCGLYIIIPCYNENAGVLHETLRKIDHGLPGCHIVVVDDGSRAPVRINDSSVTVLRHIVNRGQGAALQTGMAYACRQNDMAFVAHFDADGQHCPEDVRHFIQYLENAPLDIVLGSRFLSQSDAMAVPVLRRILLLGGRLVNRLFTGIWLTDAHNGLRCMNRHAAEAIDLHEDRMAHASEILNQIRRHHLRYAEKPCHIEYSDYSRSKGQGAFNAVNILLDLVMERFL